MTFSTDRSGSPSVASAVETLLIIGLIALAMIGLAVLLPTTAPAN